MNNDEKILKVLEELQDGQKNLVKAVKVLQQGQQKQGKDIAHIRKTVDVLVKWTDEADVDLQRRMSRVEKVLDLPPLEHQKH
jgi:seryl-tRNA synthetase